MTPSLQVPEVLHAIVAQMRQMARPSPIVPLLDALLDDSLTSAEDVTRVVALDPTIALRMLRAANSAYFALPEPVTDLAQAIQYIGLEVVRDVARQSSILSLFTIRLPEQPELNARLGGLWQHAIATAAAARILARCQGSAVLLAVAAGLLHDIGKVALLLAQPDAYARALRMATAERIHIVAAERRLLPCDHATLGRALCLAWNLPDEVALAVGRHHSVRAGARTEACSDLAAIVHVADILARALGAGWWGDGVMPHLDPAARAALDLQSADARTLLDALEADYPRAAATLGTLYAPRVLEYSAPSLHR
jgi:putative nucleotidyltransferase with HDIG domain